MNEPVGTVAVELRADEVPEGEGIVQGGELLAALPRPIYAVESSGRKFPKWHEANIAKANCPHSLRSTSNSTAMGALSK